MSKARRILLLQRERREEIVLRRAVRQRLCRECGRDRDFLSLDQAVTVSGYAARFLFQLAEAGRIHFAETASGHFLVCAESLREEKNRMEER